MSGTISLIQKRRPNRAAFAIALGLAALGALLIWQGAVIPDKGGYAGIGSGAAPTGVGVVLILLALGHLNSGLKTTVLPHSYQNRAAIGWILAGLLLQLFLLKPLGFTIASALLFACTARAMGYKRLHIALAAGLVLAFVVYGVFDGLLKLNLPAGFLEHLIYRG
jgi:putative tricarboxylic transport membrane protein